VRQLQNKSPHTGPFTIERVWFNYNEDFMTEATFQGDNLEVYIAFKHDQRACADAEEPGNTPCTVTVWSPYESPSTTIDMLNELLATDS
jgi:hypothetical protein